MLLRFQTYHCVVHTVKCCSVVFGVTMRLLVINASCSSPAINKPVACQRLVSSTCHGLSQLSVLHLAVKAFTAREGARYWLRSRFLPNQPAFDTPIRGYPSEYYHNIWCGKTRMVWLSDGEKNLKIRLVVLTECTNVTDRQTDGQTDK